LFGQESLPPDLSRVMQEAVKQRHRYVESFKNLTAAETKTTEIIVWPPAPRWSPSRPGSSTAVR
jgi:hypothetical protein